MSSYPVITIQCDWNEVLRLPNNEAWISSKYLNENSVHGKLKTSITPSKKVDVILPEDYEYVSHSALSLVVRHVKSDLKVAFVAPTKSHLVHNKAILSVDAAENALVVSSCEEDKLLVWDSRTSEVVQDLKGHGGPIYKCRLFPSGVVALSAGADGSARIWCTNSGNNAATLVGHKMAVVDVSIIDRGRNVITVSKDGSAKLWDVGKSNCLANILEGHGAINCCDLAITDDDVTEITDEREIGTSDKALVVGCECGLVICAQVSRREQLFSKQMDSPVNACVVIEETVIVGCNNGKVIQLNLRDGSTMSEWCESASPVLSLASLGNQMFVIGRQDGTCTVLSLQSNHKNIRVNLTGSDFDGIRDLAFNGKWIFAGCRDKNIRKYDLHQVVIFFK